MKGWLSDFELRDGKILVRETGAELSLDFALVREVMGWFPFYLLVRFSTFLAGLKPRPKPRVGFVPGPARPWYLLPFLTQAARYRRTKLPEKADILIYFEDKTLATPPHIPADFTGKMINFACTDISKTRVAEVFADIFGYGLAVDPCTYTGLMAVKSEKNGAHDGMIVQGPVKPEEVDASLVYQRLIDNRLSEGDDKVIDLRCPTVNGKIGLIFIKHRPLHSRFANFNARVELARPEDYLSAEERTKLAAFARAMRLDFGGLDVLRDRSDGRIYVVDVNKTDMGPPIALPLADKFRATRILTKQLKDFFGG